MGDLSFQLQKQLSTTLRAGDLSDCEQIVLEKLRQQPRSPFHSVLELAISNEPVEVARYFDDFFLQQPRERVQAAYTEMNGLDINPNLWWCSPFAYQDYGGHDDYDWLSNWQSGDYDCLPITGLEELQKIYASEASGEADYSDACELASLAVVIKFQDLIRRAVPFMNELRFPLLATAHDYDFIFEVRNDI